MPRSARPATAAEVRQGFGFWISDKSGRRINLDDFAKLLDRVFVEIPRPYVRDWLQQLADEAAAKARRMILAGKAIKAISAWEKGTYSPLTVLIRNMELLAGYPSLPAEAKTWYVNTKQLAESFTGTVLMARGFEGTIVVRPRPAYRHARAGRALNAWHLWNLLQGGGSYQVTAERREAILGYLYALACTIGWINPSSRDYAKFKDEVVPLIPRIGSVVYLPPRPLFVGEFLKEIRAYIRGRVTAKLRGLATAVAGWVNYDCHPRHAPEVWRVFTTRVGELALELH